MSKSKIPATYGQLIVWASANYKKGESNLTNKDAISAINQVLKKTRHGQVTLGKDVPLSQAEIKMLVDSLDKKYPQ
jgi:hypothetical protein